MRINHHIFSSRATQEGYVVHRLNLPLGSADVKAIGQEHVTQGTYAMHVSHDYIGPLEACGNAEQSM